ncbi:conserved hypothetical protein [Gloeothece citriformis PCC 7424]|uniref:DUF6671 domain-containing protein n=1 Tax=Gloeothece citriformis (strain PCC 7424) TaxID=65393 RepID=B7KGS8_GLOC7|nr:DUF6671 family protein [Gloeothece citriformis]ACK72005.1 conserved hypothetical protein [Gloeothece citriformis PCC 7424]
MANVNEWFKNRVAVLATMHQKERAIAPVLESELGVKVQVPANFNTDFFGTFTREIKRLGTQIEAARLKAEKALEITGETLAIASEGSFFPHPAFPFVSCDREILLFLDKEHNLEIIGQEISPETNHSHKTIKTVQEALDFAQKVGFPEHGLVVMVSVKSTDHEEIFKGIDTEETLIEAVETALRKSPDGTIHLETDMRAMYNPTRMKVIEIATHNLIKKIHQQCPQCFCPGFDLVERQSGLPCGLCYAPTSLILLDIYQCQRCNYREEKRFPEGKETADPAQCIYCNP